MRAESRALLARLRIEIADTDRPVEKLSGGQRQAVAIARALRWNARIVIMDEPTAALGVAESREVLDLVRALQRGGTTVILISHNMADIVAVASRVAVLKNGSKIAELPVAGLDADDLAHLVMTGQRLRAA
jgi:simple sugar transport system ATP-binding protein